MTTTTQSLLSGPMLYQPNSFFYNGFVYSFSPTLLPDNTIVSLNGMPAIIKYKLTSKGPVYLGIVGVSGISLTDVTSNFLDGIRLYNGRAYINMTNGSTAPGVFIIELSDLETNKFVITPRVQQFPNPADLNYLNIGPDGIVYLTTSVGSSGVITDCYLLVSKIQSNGLMGSFVTSNIPRGYYCNNFSGTNFYPNHFVTMPGGFLVSNYIQGTVCPYAIKINPLTGIGYTYSAPIWTALAKQYSIYTFTATDYGNRSDGVLTSVFAGSSSLSLYYQTDNNDIISTIIVNQPASSTTQSFFITEKYIYTLSIADDNTFAGPVGRTPMITP